jgi:hypothetical protein
MTIERWQSLPAYEQPKSPTLVAVKGLWLLVADLLLPKRMIKIEASGSWSDLSEKENAVGPDGHLGLTLPADQLISSNAPVGALMGKIGGSTADRITGTAKRDDGIIVLPLGTYCIIGPLDKAAPLFVAVNGAWSVAEFRFLDLKVKISTSEP